MCNLTEEVSCYKIRKKRTTSLVGIKREIKPLLPRSNGEFTQIRVKTKTEYFCSSLKWGEGQVLISFKMTKI